MYMQHPILFLRFLYMHVSDICFLAHPIVFLYAPAACLFSWQEQLKHEHREGEERTWEHDVGSLMTLGVRVE